MKRSMRLLLLVALIILSLACSMGNSDKKEPAEAPAGEKPEATAEKTKATQTPQSSEVELGDTQYVEMGGFSFRPIPDYLLDINGGFVTMLAAGSDPEIGPVFNLIGGPTTEMTNDELFEEMKDQIDVELGEPEHFTVGGKPGLILEVSDSRNGQDLTGKIVMVMVTPTQQFVMMVGTPKNQWTQIEPLAMALLDSVSFSEIQTMLPTLDIESGWYVYSNANKVRDLIVYDNIAYAATFGGMVAWNLESSYPMKYTPLQGMGHISAHSITACDLSEKRDGSKNRIVVGTQQGLSFYEPSTGLWDNTSITPDDVKLHLSTIDSLYCDTKNHRLLIGYFGLGVLDLETGEWQHFTKKEGLTWDGVRDMTVSGKDIWVASGYNGISKISGDKITTFDEKSGMPSERANAIAAAADGTIWIGTAKGLVKFKGGQWTLYDRESSPGIGGDLSSVEIDTDGSIWVASAPIGTGTVCRFDPKKEKCSVTFDDPGKQAIIALALGIERNKVAFGTRNGVYLYDGNVAKPMILENEQLASNFVDTFATDPSGMLWVGTDGGIQKLDPANPDMTWETFKAERNNENSPGGNWAKSIAVGKGGTVWFGIINGSASRLRDGQWTAYKDYYSYDSVVIDKQGRVWLGDDSKGITVLDDSGQVVMTLTEAEGLPNKGVRTLLADGDTIWIGTIDGLAKYEGDKLSVVFGKDDKQLPSDSIGAMVVEPDGKLLLGTVSGLVRYDGSQVEILLDFRKDSPFTSITNLAVEKSGRIWVGTNNGLYHSDDSKSWTQLTTNDGLPTNDITALHVDQYGTLWVGGGSSVEGGGILRIVP